MTISFEDSATSADTTNIYHFQQAFIGLFIFYCCKNQQIQK
jgi:hypothetical protein